MGPVNDDDDDRPDSAGGGPAGDVDLADEPVPADEPDLADEPDPAGVDTRAGPSRVRTALVVVALVVVAALGVSVALLVNERADLQDRVEQLEESLRIARGDAGAQIELLEGENTELAQQVLDLDTELAATSDTLTATRAEADDLAQRLDERSLERDDARAQIEELEAQLAEIGSRFAPMPVLVGAELDAAEAFAEEIDAQLLVEEAAPVNVIARPGAIIEQLPIDGTVILPGSVIWVQVYTPDPDS